MRSIRAFLVAGAVLVAGLLGSSACGVETVGLDACRQIESARCEEAPSCPDLGVKDVDACKRYYRDQCLHGLSISESPGTPAVDKCVNAIHAAGKCAQAGSGTCNVAQTSTPT